MERPPRPISSIATNMLHSEELSVRDAVVRILDRIGHAWVENPWSILSFPARLGVAMVTTERASGEHEKWRLWILTLEQIARTTIRGIVPTAAVGVVLAFSIGVLSRSIGTIVRPLFESIALTNLFENILPLLLLMIVVLRNGSSIAAKFASLPAGARIDARLNRDLSFSDDQLLDHAVPHLIASTLSALPLFALLTHATIAGYISHGDFLAEIWTSPLDSAAFLELRNLLTSFWIGLAKGATYCLIVAWISLALGIQAAERVMSDDDEPYDFFNAVWESGVTSLLVCTVIAMITWAK